MTGNACDSDQRTGTEQGSGVSASTWYDEYLSSPHWRNTRIAKIEQVEGICNRCSHRGVFFDGFWWGIHVHHITYDRMGCEEMSDLEVLCVECHKMEHGFTDEAVGANKAESAKVVRQFLDAAASVDEVELEIQAWDDLIEAAGF